MSWFTDLDVMSRTFVLAVASALSTLAIFWPIVRRRSRRARQLAYAGSVVAAEAWMTVQMLGLSSWRVDLDIVVALSFFALVPVGVYFVTGWIDEMAERGRQITAARGRPLNAQEARRLTLFLGALGVALALYIYLVIRYG